MNSDDGRDIPRLQSEALERGAWLFGGVVHETRALSQFLEHEVSQKRALELVLGDENVGVFEARSKRAPERIEIAPIAFNVCESMLGGDAGEFRQVRHIDFYFGLFFLARKEAELHAAAIEDVVQVGYGKA
jgi:hypothetical protein